MSSKPSASATRRSARAANSGSWPVFLGRQTPLTYRIVEYDPPHAVTFRGESSTVVSLDRITFESSEQGTRITYDADLALKGPFKLADPLLGVAFKRVGDRALAGLRKTVGAGH